YLTNEPLYVSPEGWIKQAGYSAVAPPWNDATVFYHNNTNRALEDNALVYALKVQGGTLTIPNGVTLENASGEFLIQGNILGDGDVNLGAKEALIYLNGNPLRFEPRLNTTGGATLFGGGRLAVPKVTWSGGTHLHNSFLILDNADDIVWDMAVTGDIYGPPVTANIDSGLVKNGAGKLTIQNAAAAHVSDFTISAGSGDIEIKDSNFASMRNGVALNQDGMKFTVTNSIYRYGGGEFRTATGRNNITVEVIGTGDPSKPTMVLGRGGTTDSTVYPVNGNGVTIGYSAYGNSLLVDGMGVTGGAVWSNMVYNVRGLSVGNGAGASNNVAKIVNGGEVWDENSTNNAGNGIGLGAGAASNRVEVIGGAGHVSKLVKASPNNIGNGLGADGNLLLIDGKGTVGSAVLQFISDESLTVGNATGTRNRLIARDGAVLTRGSLNVGRGSAYNFASFTGTGTSWTANGGNSTFEIGMPFSTRTNSVPAGSSLLQQTYHSCSNLVYIADGARVSNFSKWQTVIGGQGSSGGSTDNFGNSIGNTVLVSTNGYWNVPNELHIGRVFGAGNYATENALIVSGPGATVMANYVNVGNEHGNDDWGRSQSFGNMLIVENEGYLQCQNIASGTRNANTGAGDVFGNRIIVRDNGHLYASSTVRLGADNDFHPHDNLFEAYGNGIIEVNTVRLDSPSNNVMRIHDGGVWQLRGTRAPAFANRRAGELYKGVVSIENGVVAITNSTTSLVNDNWTQAGWHTYVTWSGNNGYRMNNIELSTGGANSYLFESTLGPTNYCRLEMVNGATVYRTSTADANNPLQIGAAVGTLASMLCSNTLATVSLPFICNGRLDIANSTLTLTKGAEINGTLAIGKGLVVFEAPALVTGEVIVDLANLPDGGVVISALNGLTLGPGASVRFTGAMPEGLGRENPIMTGVTGGRFGASSGLPPNWSAKQRDGDVFLHFALPRTIFMMR
ncbi:MAG: hypothetical protein FWF96_03935, partial [Kiritimatiellaeota bacterium]|nr:hypothetical protein [Kiritimatiellota bacterium]